MIGFVHCSTNMGLKCIVCDQVIQSPDLLVPALLSFLRVWFSPRSRDVGAVVGSVGKKLIEGNGDP